ncbi:MAG: ATP phosphoribosyltransferase regulatory subunit [Clostridiales Family XIII bacterium]|jgi:ATP phosphoribosyltransferase regulatory subunit|nr:ATP phosphoribosyltransferase regulatory subunit [Clostridiales Family XIII bacterium]
MYDKITPEGTRDILFEECAVQNRVTGQLRAVFEGAGFREVKTPGFEFYDAFASRTDAWPQDSLYTMTDGRGRLITVRPDSTIPIARLAVSKLKGHELPVRLFYAQNVFRRQQEHSGRSAETTQMGVELIGAGGFASDVESLALAASALRATAGRAFRIEIGHVGIYNLLMDGLDAPAGDKALIHRYIASKNYAALNDILDRVRGQGAAEILRRLPRLFGTAEALAEASALMAGYDERLSRILSDLKRLLATLAEKGLDAQIMVDFGLVNQADYYSSLVFRGYIEDSGTSVLSGGRYDGLLEGFGEALPAIGFALSIDQITATGLRRQEAESDAQTQGETLPSSVARKTLRVALTKGRIEERFILLLEAAGYDCSSLRAKGRKLLLALPGTGIELFLAKASDVITYVEHGVCDVGIVGKDTIAEQGGTYYEILDLGIGRCRFALAAPEGRDFYAGYGTKVIATKYPNVTNRYFERKGMDVETIRIEGSVEIAPLLGLADGIVDLVETGTTLRENGLAVIEDIRDVTTRFIVNATSMKMKKAEIDAFAGRLEQVLSQASVGEGGR